MIPIKESAPAKVNLRLEVIGKRADGYHDLAMIMTAVDLHDTITVAPSDRLFMTCSEPSLPCDETNLVIKAARAFEAHIGLAVPAAIHLDKQTPMAAGLGGGSSDAAAVLRALNRMTGASLSASTMEQIGAKVGADVPFFIRNGAKVAEGIGDRLAIIEFPVDFHIVLINPGFSVSTAKVFGNFRLTRQDQVNTVPSLLSHRGEILNFLQAGRVENVLHNDLESVVLRDYPEVAKIKDFLGKVGCVGRLMSGSGPTVFGIAEDGRTAAGIARQAQSLGYRAWATTTLASWI